jgi:hypothetical protein
VFEVEAASCGVRDSGSVNGTLNAAIVVYPNDTYTLTFSLPSAKQWSGGVTGAIGLDSSSTDVSMKSSTLGQTDSSVKVSSSTDKTGDTTSALTIKQRISGDGTGLGSQVLAQGETVSYSQTVNPDKVSAKLEFDKSVTFTPGIKLKKNGHEIDLSKVINDLLNMYQTIVGAVEEIQKLKPELGWSITFDLKIFEGTIAASWGNRLDPDPEGRGDRYTAVDRYYNFDFNLTLFAFTFTLMVGVDVTVDAVFWKVASIQAKLEGTLKANLALKDSYTNKADPNEDATGLVATGTGTISGTAGVNIMGYYLLATAEVEGGVQFTGKLLISCNQSPKVTGKVERLKTVLTYQVGAGKGEAPQPVEIPLYEGAPLWEGVLPS